MESRIATCSCKLQDAAFQRYRVALVETHLQSAGILVGRRLRLDHLQGLAQVAGERRDVAAQRVRFHLQAAEVHSAGLVVDASLQRHRSGR